MIPGDVALLPVPQFGAGARKLRPVVILAALPGPYQNILTCGVSSQIHQIQPNWDETVAPGDADFVVSGLRRASVIRLSYLYAADSSELVGIIGRIDLTRLDRLLSQLAGHLHP